MLLLQLHQRLNILEILDKLVTENEAYWINLLNQYLLKNKSATIRGRPSKVERQRLSDEEEKRIEKQRKDLGPEGLKKCEKELEDAIAYNEVLTFACLFLFSKIFLGRFFAFF